MGWVLEESDSPVGDGKPEVYGDTQRGPAQETPISIGRERRREKVNLTCTLISKESMRVKLLERVFFGFKLVRDYAVAGMAGRPRSSHLLMVTCELHLFSSSHVSICCSG